MFRFQRLQHRLKHRRTMKRKAQKPKQIESLQDFNLEIFFLTRKAKIELKIEMTMLNRKALNTITDTNLTQSSNVCSAKPCEINKLDIAREKVCNEQVLALGLSTLHCWIRIFEFTWDIKWILKDTSPSLQKISCL